MTASVLEPFRRTADTQAENVDLEYLDLSLREFVPLVARLGSMPRLRSLSLAGNRLTDLPSSISSLKALEYLDVTQNMFGKVDRVIHSLKGLPRLRELHITLDEEEEEAVLIALPGLENLNGVSLDDEDDQGNFEERAPAPSEGFRDARGPPLPHQSHTNAISGHADHVYTDTRRLPATPVAGEGGNSQPPGHEAAMQGGRQDAQRCDAGLQLSPLPVVSMTKQDLEAVATMFQRVKRLVIDRHASEQTDSETGSPTEAEARMSKAFEAHVDSVIGTLNARLEGVAEPGRRHTEILLAKHGLYDICFQETIAYAGRVHPELSQILAILSVAHSGLFQTLEGVCGALGAQHQQLQAALEESRAQCARLSEAAASVEQEARAQEKEVLQLREELRRALREDEARMQPKRQDAEAARKRAHTAPTRGMGGPTGNSSVNARPNHQAKQPERERAGAKQGWASLGSATNKQQASSPGREKRTGTHPDHLGGQAREFTGESFTIRDLTLKQLKDFIEQIYSSKAKQDARCEAAGLPRETVEQHMYSFLHHRFGLRQLIVENATAILKATHTMQARSNDVRVFAKILRNDIDEEFRQVQLQIKQTVRNLLRNLLRGRNSLKSDDIIAAMVAERVEGGSLEESEWREVISYMYNDVDSETLARVIIAHVQAGKTPEGQRVNDMLAVEAGSQAGWQPGAENVDGNVGGVGIWARGGKFGGKQTGKPPGSSVSLTARPPSPPGQPRTNQGEGYARGHAGEQASRRQATASRAGVFDPPPEPLEHHIKYADLLEIILDFQLEGHDRFLSQFRELFRKLDLDRDGVITTHQFVDLGRKVNPASTLEDLRGAIELADPGNAGSVAFSSAVTALSSGIVEMMVQVAEQARRERGAAPSLRSSRS